MGKNQYKISLVLSFIVAMLAIIASSSGLLINDLYRDNDFIKAVWIGNDIVTLFVAIPILIASLFFTIRGSNRALLIWMGSLWYMIYNYVFYLYGAAFNKIFLVYVALFTLATYALIFALVKIDIQTMGEKFNPRTPVKIISGIMIFIALALGVPWIVMSVNFIFTNQVPQAIIQSNHPTSVVFATDLSFFISNLILITILLLKRNPWGYVLSTVILVKGVLYPVVLLIGGIKAYLAIKFWDPLIPLYLLLGALCLIALLVLINNLHEKNIS